MTLEAAKQYLLKHYEVSNENTNEVQSFYNKIQNKESINIEGFTKKEQLKSELAEFLVPGYVLVLFGLFFSRTRNIKMFSWCSLRMGVILSYHIGRK